MVLAQLPKDWYLLFIWKDARTQSTVSQDYSPQQKECLGEVEEPEAQMVAVPNRCSHQRTEVVEFMHALPCAYEEQVSGCAISGWR